MSSKNPNSNKKSGGIGFIITLFILAAVTNFSITGIIAGVLLGLGIGKIDEYGFYAVPGVCWCEYKNFPIRIEATVAGDTAWFRVRFPEECARNVLVDSRYSAEMTTRPSRSWDSEETE